MATPAIALALRPATQDAAWVQEHLAHRLDDPGVRERVRVLRSEVRRRDARPNDGRCGNVAAAIEAHLGWERQWGYLKLLDATVSWVHCWNVAPDGTIIDATADQFQDLWLGDVVVLGATDRYTTHYLHAPRAWEIHFEERDATRTPGVIRCVSEHDHVVVPADRASPWRSFAGAVLRLLTGWDLDDRLVSLAARSLRARASTSDAMTTDELTRPLVTESIHHLARGREPWVASEFADPV